jgi:molecular chaperone Hsp33
MGWPARAEQWLRGSHPRRPVATKGQEIMDRASQDSLLPFQLENRAARGRLADMSGVVDVILKRHAYPQPVASLLGELVTLTALLGGMLKFDGIFTVQIRGEGPVRLMVADMTTAGHMRGFAQFDAEQVAGAEAEADRAAGPAMATASEPRRLAHFMESAVPRLLGTGHLAFTVDQGPHTQRYQGIVSLDGDTLADCVRHYFAQSDQLQTSLKIAIGHEETPDPAGGPTRGRWRAAGLLLQRMPEEGGINPLAAPQGEEAQPDADLSEQDADERWNRARILMESCTDAELLDETLPGGDLLYRLFHEDGVRVWERVPLSHQCRCSRGRLERLLASLPQDEVLEMRTETGDVTVDCEFCIAHYRFTPDDLDAIFRADAHGLTETS